MSSLFVVVLLFAIFYLIAKWYKNHNKGIMDKYVNNKNNDYIFIEQDNSKAIGINERNKIVNIYTIDDNDNVKELSFNVNKINKVEVIEDNDAEQKCKYVRLNIYIDDKSDFSLFQIIFLAPTWTLDGHDGFQKSSDKYLKARQQANKFITIINSLKS